MILSFIYIFFASLAVWLCLCSSFHIHELIAGAVVSFIVSLFFARSYNKLGLPRFGIKRAGYSVLYIIRLGWEITKANFDVAYRVLHPAMPIKPGIVAVRTGLKSDAAKLVLANSITLTPGTFTVDIVGDTLLVHWIYVESGKMEEATKKIGEKFEKYLRVIFE